MTNEQPNEDYLQYGKEHDVKFVTPSPERKAKRQCFGFFLMRKKSETVKCWLHYDCILNTYLEVDLMPLLRFDVIEGRSKRN